MTVHNAQGQTLGHAVIDLASCICQEQPYVIVLRVASSQGLMVLHDFDAR